MSIICNGEVEMGLGIEAVAKPRRAVSGNPRPNVTSTQHSAISITASSESLCRRCAAPSSLIPTSLPPTMSLDTRGFDPSSALADLAGTADPTFFIERVQLQFEVSKFVAVQVANNVIILALETGKLMRIDLASPQDVDGLFGRGWDE